MSNQIITLLTDFGTSDTYVGILKGIIAGIAPSASVIDLTHEIPPQNIQAGALALDRAYQYFPAGTIHLAVVDPGVGSSRRAIAMRADKCLFVGPDNGLFTMVIKKARENQSQVTVCTLENPRYRLEPPSPVFHGRDLFAPAAAYLAAGVALEEFGEEVSDPVEIDLPKPVSTGSGWLGEVWAVDNFGSLETNITSEHLVNFNPSQIKILLANRTIKGIVQSYSDGKKNELVALVDSAGRISISIVNGNAAEILQVGVKTPVEISFKR